MSQAPSVTAAIITLNEAAHMPGLLRSLAWADEIVVVDGGSRDATVEIARNFGCRVLEHAFDTYAAQRNRAIAAAQSQWVLSIDADERPTPYLVEELRGRILWSSHVAYRVPIRSRIFGRRMRFSGTQDDRPIRLFARELCRWQGDVHEVLNAPGRIGMLQGWLDHDTLPDLSAFLSKMERYTTLEASRRVADGVPPRFRDQWLAPAVEIARRLVWKGGLLDGPQGWAFCLLSGLSQWVQGHKHRCLWQHAHRAATPIAGPTRARTQATERCIGNGDAAKSLIDIIAGGAQVSQSPRSLTGYQQEAVFSPSASRQHAPSSVPAGPPSDRVCFPRRIF